MLYCNKSSCDLPHTISASYDSSLYRQAHHYVNLTTIHWYKATKEVHNTPASLLDEAPIRRVGSQWSGVVPPCLNPPQLLTSALGLLWLNIVYEGAARGSFMTHGPRVHKLMIGMLSWLLTTDLRQGSSPMFVAQQTIVRYLPNISWSICRRWPT